MTILTSFTHAHVTHSPSGGQHIYGFRGPPLTNGGAFVRLTFKAPSIGPLSIQSAHFGTKGVGALDFSGDQQPILFGGNAASPLIAAGTEIMSDPIAIAVATNDVPIWRYDLDAPATGWGYGVSVNLAATYAGGYKSGLGGTGNGNDGFSGYTSYTTPATASLVKIEVSDVLADFTPPVIVPPVVANVDVNEALMAAMINNEFAAAGGVVPGVVGEYTHFLLRNPLHSGVNIFLGKIVITPDADTIATLRGDEDRSGQVVLPNCNAWFSLLSEPPKGTLYKYHNAAIQGGQHDIYKLKGGVEYNISLPWPLIGLAPLAVGGASLALHQPGVGATVSMFWREKPIV